MTAQVLLSIISVVLVVIGVVAVIALCLGGLAWIDFRQSKLSVQRGGRGFSSGSQLRAARRSVRSARARARRYYS